MDFIAQRNSYLVGTNFSGEANAIVGVWYTLKSGLVRCVDFWTAATMECRSLENGVEHFMLQNGDKLLFVFQLIYYAICIGMVDCRWCTRDSYVRPLHFILRSFDISWFRIICKLLYRDAALHRLDVVRDNLRLRQCVHFSFLSVISAKVIFDTFSPSEIYSNLI